MSTPISGIHSLRLCGVNYESFVDGDGLRATFFLAGCPHQCPGCHNPSTWSSNSGELITTEVVLTIEEELRKRPYVTGITLSGGDPFLHPLQTVFFLQNIRMLCPHIKSVWCYTGYTYEQLTHPVNAGRMVLLSNIDVLVDGRFEQDKADRSLLFRGSSNQRIIDVPESLKQNTVCLWRGGDY